MANIAKAVMGAGVFSLPWATARGGLLFVPAFIAAAAALSLYTLSVLVNAKRALLTDAGEAASGAAGGPLALRLSSYTALIEAALGGPAGRLAEALNVACCFGICAAYLVFIASTLATVAWGAAAGPAATERLVWAITPAMVGLSWLRSMAGVSLMAAAGNASVLAGMAFVAVRAARTQPWLGAGLPLAQPQGFGAYFGSVALCVCVCARGRGRLDRGVEAVATRGQTTRADAAAPRPAPPPPASSSYTSRCPRSRLRWRARVGSWARRGARSPPAAWSAPPSARWAPPRSARAWPAT